MDTILLTVVYFLSGILFIISHYSPSRFPSVFLKASIIPLLIIIFAINRLADWNSNDTILLTALVCSWGGDIMLTKKSSGFFQAGIAFFMLTHIMYFIVFIRTGNGFIFEKPVFFIPLILYEVILISYLFNHLERMKIPVILYSTVIMIMLASAINRYGAVTPKSFSMVLWGAILFAISDSALAINKIKQPFRLYQLVVMLTYITAQYLIVEGYIRQFREF